MTTKEIKKKIIDFKLLPVLVPAFLYILGLSYFAGGYNQLNISAVVNTPNVYSILVNGFYALFGSLMFYPKVSGVMLVIYVIVIYRFTKGCDSGFKLSIASILFIFPFSLITYLSGGELSKKIESEARQFLSNQVENTNYSTKVAVKYSVNKADISSIEGMLLSTSGDFLIVIQQDVIQVIPRKNIMEIIIYK